MRRDSRNLVPLALTLALCACGGTASASATPGAIVSEPTPSSTTSPSPTAVPSPSATPWPNVELPPFPGSVAATDWQSTVEPPPGMGRDDTSYADPETLLDDLAAMLRGPQGPEGPEVRAEFLIAPDETRALALIHVYDVPDDSVAGTEYVVTFEPGANGWYVAVSDERTHCRRGVDNPADLCV